MKRILVVEDDLSLKPILQPMILKIQPKARIDWLTSAEEAFDRLNIHRGAYDVVLSDISLAGEKSGIDLVEDCYQNRISAQFVLTSGSDDISTRLPFLHKPLKLADVDALLGPFLKAHKPPPKDIKLERHPLDDTLDQRQALGWFFLVFMTTVYMWIQATR